MLRHLGMRDTVMSYCKIYNIQPGNVHLLNISISFDPSVLEVFCPLTRGALLVIPTQTGHTDPEYLGALIKHHKVDTIMLSVPSVVQAYLTSAGMREAMSYIHQIGIGGEPLPVTLVNKLHDLMPCRNGVINWYGPTECSVQSTHWRVPCPCPPMTIGTPDHNVGALVVDPETKRLLPVGAPGELWIAGPRVGAGYVGREDLTALAFVENPFYDAMVPYLPTALAPYFKRCYRTGDLVRWTPEGLIDYLGRIDRQVKLNGVRMELSEVEEALRSAPGVGLAAAAVVKHQGRATLVAYAQVAPDGVAAVLAHCRKTLLASMVPSLVVPVEGFVLLPNGKLDYKALPQLDWDALMSAAGPSEEYVAPRNEVESKLQSIWGEILQQKEPVGVQSDFFRLGGNSLKAIGLIGMIRQTFNIKVGFGKLLKEATIAQMAAIISEELGTASITSESARSGTVAATRPLSLPTVTAHKWEGEFRPVSSGQEQMFTLSTLDTLGYQYNSAVAYRLEGELRPNMLQVALKEITSRHEVLRSAFRQTNDGVQVFIASESSVDIPLIYTDLSGPDCEERLEKEVRAALHHSFNLGTAPLARGLLFNLGPNKQYLLLTFHHVVIDGWSMGVFMKELTTIYNAIINGTEVSPMSPVKLQYADYAAWQKDWLNGSEAAEQLDYWETTLKGCPDLLQLPRDHPRPAVATHAGALELFELDSETAASLNSFAKHCSTSPFVVLLTLYRFVLSRYTGQADFALGAAYQMRPQGMEDSIGYFVNTLPLRRTVEEEASFESAVSEEHRVVLEAIAHGAVPFQNLVAALEIARSAAYNPLLQAMMVFQDECKPIIRNYSIEYTLKINLGKDFDLKILIKFSSTSC